MTGCSKPMLCSTGTSKNCSLAKTVTIYVCQSLMVISRPLPITSHSSNWKKKKENLPGKPTKFPGPTLNTMNYHQYFPEMTKGKEKKKTHQKKTPPQKK
ncbi:hypothetical protein G9A89_022288 [Geosiphon pyriformis]|nr:hypothetical protein G9A89_022288 [Geosiphon pyriformis]